jgi:hypothetical protein
VKGETLLTELTVVVLEEELLFEVEREELDLADELLLEVETMEVVEADVVADVVLHADPVQIVADPPGTTTPIVLPVRRFCCSSTTEPRIVRTPAASSVRRGSRRARL